MQTSWLQHYDYKYGVYNPATNTVDETKNNGQIARIEGFIATAKQWQQNFAYDSLGRLSSAREYRGDNSQQSWLVNYEYDLFGNRYQKQVQNGGNPFTQKWTESGDINQATNRYATGVTYDDAGNLLTDPKFRNLQYQYDANNRQKQSANSDGSNAVISVYDAGGQRVATQVGTSLTNVLVYDAMGRLVAEYDSAPPASNGTQFVTADHQGSPRAITGPTGTVVSRHDYAPFGEDLPSNVGMRTTPQGYSQPDAVRQKYAGMEADDATGMSHTLWRQYDSRSGRWTAPDPYSGSMTIANPQSFNRYSYVDNDPVNKIDSLGLMGADASTSWGDVSGMFWGSSDFGGPETGRSIAQNGMNGFSDRTEEVSYCEEGDCNSEGEAQQQRQGGDPSVLTGTVVDPQQSNPNSIEKAVEDGTLGPTNNIEANTRTGGNIHDGIHVVPPVGSLAAVTALPAMAGTVDHVGRQGVKGNPGYNYSVVYIVLKHRYQGQRLVLSLVDMHFDTGSLKRKDQPVVPGRRLGFVDNSGGPGESGLHVTLMTYATYNKYIRNRWSYAARQSVPARLLIDAARDPRSPFRSQ